MIILFEYDKPITVSGLFNYSPGVWYYQIIPDATTWTDDYAVTMYYEDTNTTKYYFKSLAVDQVAYSITYSVVECQQTKGSFYYDFSDSVLYIHLVGSEPPLDSAIDAGSALGLCYGKDSESGHIFDGKFYDPRLTKVFAIKKSVDPLFYGVHKYQQGKITALNGDGYFDDWRERDLFGQAARILVGNDGDDYADYQLIYSGYIEDDSRTWSDFNLTIQDLRKSLSQSIATNKYDTTTYPYLDPDDAGESIPVAYGNLFGVQPMCVNKTQSTTTWTFKLCDTTYNSISSIGDVRVNGVVKTAGNVDLSAATFTLTSSQLIDADSNLQFDAVRVDFVATSITNGVDILKDLMLNYDDKTYLSSFWDTTEVDAAQLQSRASSLYIDQGDKKLSDAIKSVCIDIDARMFVKDNGVYTIRIYDPNRTPVKVIQSDEWIGEPDITNNGSEYLSSAIIKYKHQQKDDEYNIYENTNYQARAFEKYKKLKTETFETNITTEPEAIAKSETIMSQSYSVTDIVTRSTVWANSDIEICDFIIADPTARYSRIDTPVWAIYEVLGTEKNPEAATVKLTMRYVRASDYVVPVYDVLVDEIGQPIIDEMSNYIAVPR